jgi:hypothetical protein
MSLTILPSDETMKPFYRHQQNLSDHLWITAIDRHSELTLPIPPEPETHRAAVRQAQRLRNSTVWYAALSEQYGAWEAFWEEEKVRYAAWAGTSPFQNGEQFKTIVENLRVA